MALASNAKKKSARGKKDDPKFRIAEWIIEPSTTPGEVHLSFVAVKESDTEMSRSTTQRFLLRRERAEELVKELKEVLEDFAATRRLEEQAASSARVPGAQTGAMPGRSMADDTDMLSNHFALGAYGLVGN
jgi:hypothetical protein